MRSMEGLKTCGGRSRTRYAAGAIASDAMRTGTNSGTGANAKCAIAKSALGALTAFW